MMLGMIFRDGYLIPGLAFSQMPDHKRQNPRMSVIQKSFCEQEKNHHDYLLEGAISHRLPSIPFIAMFFCG